MKHAQQRREFESCHKGAQLPTEVKAPLHTTPKAVYVGHTLRSLPRYARCLQGLFKIAKGEKEQDPLMTVSGLEKSHLGKIRFYSALNMPCPNVKIIAVERVQTFYWLVVGQ